MDVVPSIKSALDMSPKTIVVFTNKQLESIDPLVAAAKSAGIKLVTMGMTNDSSVQEQLAKISKIADSENRAYTFFQLQAWLDEMQKTGNEDE